MSRKRGVQAARNAPSEDRKWWQRVELGIHGLKKAGAATGLEKVRETRSSSSEKLWSGTFARAKWRVWGKQIPLPVQQFPARDFRPQNTLVLISHFANSLRIMLSRIPYLTAWVDGVARNGSCSR